MSRYSLEKLEREVADLPLEDEIDLLVFLPLASRLAGLSDEHQTHFLRWPELATRLSPDFRTLMRKRIDSGLWDLGHSVGDYLGVAMVDAEDHHCFAGLAAKLTPDACGELLGAEGMELLDYWREEAENTPLDAEAVAFLENWKQLFPLGKLRLDKMREPFSSFEESMLSSPELTAVAEPEMVSIRQAALRQEQFEIMAADDGNPPEPLKARLEQRGLPVSSECFGDFYFSRHLYDGWRFEISLEQNGAPLPVREVRFGVWTARRDAKGPFTWYLDLSTMPLRARATVFWERIWLIGAGGELLCLR